MQQPECNTEYVLVRTENDSFQYATFIRFADGSGRVVANGVQCSFELDQTTWRRKWDELLAQNYVVLEDALVSGLVKTDDIPRQYLQG